MQYNNLWVTLDTKPFSSGANTARCGSRVGRGWNLCILSSRVSHADLCTIRACEFGMICTERFSLCEKRALNGQIIHFPTAHAINFSRHTQDSHSVSHTLFQLLQEEQKGRVSQSCQQFFFLS